MTTSPHDTGSQAAVRTTSELNPSGKTFFGHPRMLANLFSVEMWERFSYYGMQGAILFIMYLLGGIAAMTVAALFKSTLLRKGTLPFYLEMPPTVGHHRELLLLQYGIRSGCSSAKQELSSW